MAAAVNINGRVAMSAAAILAAGLLVAVQAPALVAALVAGGGGDIDPDKVVATAVQKHEAAMTTNVNRVNGRSAFYTPKPTPKPVPPPQPPSGPVEPPKPPPPPGPPTTYAGPSVAFIIGDTVHFKRPSPSSTPFSLRVGEEANEVKVISVNPPWSVRVGWKKGEYDVKVFAELNSDKLFGKTGLSNMPGVMTGLVPVPGISDTSAPADESVNAPDGATRDASRTRGGGARPSNRPVLPPPTPGEEDPEDEEAGQSPDDPDEVDPEGARRRDDAPEGPREATDDSEDEAEGAGIEQDDDGPDEEGESPEDPDDVDEDGNVRRGDDADDDDDDDDEGDDSGEDEDESGEAPPPTA